ncbi:MAG: hypothetical protein WA190_17675 [Usitatibacter sp.]
MKRAGVDPALVPFLEGLAELLVAQHVREQAIQSAAAAKKSKTRRDSASGEPKAPYARPARRKTPVSEASK